MTRYRKKSKNFRRENTEFRCDLAEKKVKFLVADCTAEWRVPAAKKVKCVGRRLHTVIQCFGGEKVKYFGLRSRTSIHHFGFEKSKKKGESRA